MRSHLSPHPSQPPRVIDALAEGSERFQCIRVETGDMIAYAFPVPGRGAWTLTGGLLPIGKGKSGYYRLAKKDETPVGSSFLTGRANDHHCEVVNLGVKAIQRLMGMTGDDIDGWLGPKTESFVKSSQTEWDIEADGVVGRQTMRAALTGTITEVAIHNDIPVSILGGLLVNESSLDPAAVGINGMDHGLAQINLQAHANSVNVPMAMDPTFAIVFAAADLAATHDQWVGKTKADPWDIAVANHNSPKLAQQWAITGIPPFLPNRLIQIEDYVRRAREAW